MMSKDFEVGFDDDFLLNNTDQQVSSVLSSRCGEDVIVRINSNVLVRKRERETEEDVTVAVTDLRISITGKECEGNSHGREAGRGGREL